MIMFHLGEEVSTVARSVAVFPVEVADRAAIGRLQDNNDNHYKYIYVHDNLPHIGSLFRSHSKPDCLAAVLLCLAHLRIIFAHMNIIIIVHLDIITMVGRIMVVT